MFFKYFLRVSISIATTGCHRGGHQKATCKPMGSQWKPSGYNLNANGKLPESHGEPGLIQFLSSIPPSPSPISLGCLGLSWSLPGAILEPSWALLAASWPSQGSRGALLGLRKGPPLGAILGHLGQKHENDTKKVSRSQPKSIIVWSFLL